jgi:two-component system phosphate regulon sensor histidine kinase PhoR
MVFSAFAFFAAALYLFVLYGCYRQSAEYFQEADRFLRMVREGRPPSNDAFAYLRRVVEALDRWQTESEKNITMLRAIIESIPDAVVVAAGDGRVVYLNAGAKDVFGVTLEPDTPAGDKKMRGRKRPQWLRDALDAVGGDGKRHGRGDGAVLIEARLQEGGNNNKFLQLRVSPYYAGLNPSGMPVMVSGGMPDGVIIFAHDITGVRRLQAMRDDFVANVSHEIRTPVTAVVGFAETLLGGALDDGDNAVRFMRIIAMHAERLDRMADALTTISDLERGFVRLNKSQVDFSAAADGVIEIFKARAAEKGLRLDALYGAARVIEADTDGLFQILINLVDNAVKFTAAGEINIGICSGGDGGVYSIFVSDTGIGVPGEQVARLGERFFRVDASRARNLGGTGLGLAIVKHIVMANGWEMAFESEEGTGSTVKIFIGKKQPKNYL